MIEGDYGEIRFAEDTSPNEQDGCWERYFIDGKYCGVQYNQLLFVGSYFDSRIYIAKQGSKHLVKVILSSAERKAPIITRMV